MHHVRIEKIGLNFEVYFYLFHNELNQTELQTGPV